MKFVLQHSEPHNFKEDLQWSDDLEQWSFYLESLAHFFPETTDWQRVLEMLGQRQGKDVTLGQQNGAIVRVQIKARRKDYDDLLIEWRHDHHDGKLVLGWMEIYKPEDVSNILYTIPLERIAYNINFGSLYQAWHNGCRELWIAQYDLPPSPNKGYDTRNCGVPWEILAVSGVKFEKYCKGQTNKAS